MVKILGNSVERVSIPDLKDVIYYRQIKEYTSQEYESSRDLRKAISTGRVAKLEETSAVRASKDNGNGSGSVTIQQNGVSKEDLKDAIREVMGEKQNSGQDLAGAMREIAPLIIDTVRQEISGKLSSISVRTEEAKTTFVTPEYLPDIDIKDMTANIKADEKQISGSDINSALDVLKNMGI